MRCRGLILKCAVICAALVNVCAIAGRQQPRSFEDLRGLEIVKSFAGDWVVVDAQGNASHEAAASYAVTAKGSAVVETLYPGTDREKVTVYHGDGDKLLLTHYWADGSHARMRGEWKLETSELEFRCIGASNMTSEYARHVHRAGITIIDQNHIRAEWHCFERGQKREIETLDMVRATK